MTTRSGVVVICHSNSGAISPADTSRAASTTRIEYSPLLEKSE
ncbi:hypothetical protein [Kozakia baliensis]|nr:hypothetical protein [Kozakia baliensis]